MPTLLHYHTPLAMLNGGGYARVTMEEEVRGSEVIRHIIDDFCQCLRLDGSVAEYGRDAQAPFRHPLTTYMGV